MSAAMPAEPTDEKFEDASFRIESSSTKRVVSERESHTPGGVLVAWLASRGFLANESAIRACEQRRGKPGAIFADCMDGKLCASDLSLESVEFVRHLTRAGDFDGVLSLIAPLRDSWRTVTS